MRGRVNSTWTLNVGKGPAIAIGQPGLSRARRVNIT